MLLILALSVFGFANASESKTETNHNQICSAFEQAENELRYDCFL